MKKKSKVWQISLLSALILLSSCNGRNDSEYNIFIQDEFGMLSESYKDQLNSRYKFPKGIAVLIKTIDKIDLDDLGTYATDFHDVYNWKSFDDSRKVKSNGILILISKDPKLIQIRFGKNLILEAYRSGLAGGEKYLDIQNFFKKSYEYTGLEYALSILSKEIPDAINIPFLLKIEKTGAKETYSFLMDFVIPTDGIFNELIFKPYCNFFQKIPELQMPWLYIFTNAILLYLITKLGIILIRILVKNIRSKLVFALIWVNFCAIFLNIPFLGGLFFLSGLRQEDMLFINHLNLPHFDNLSSYPWLFQPTSWWVAIIIFISTFIRVLPEIYDAGISITLAMENSKNWNKKMLENTASDAIEPAFWKSTRFATFVLFMPQAIPILMILYNFIKIPETIKGYKFMGKYG